MEPIVERGILHITGSSKDSFRRAFSPLNDGYLDEDYAFGSKSYSNHDDSAEDAFCTSHASGVLQRDMRCLFGGGTVDQCLALAEKYDGSLKLYTELTYLDLLQPSPESKTS
jgi:hypothetical protein